MTGLYRHNKCYANGICGCSRTISREHYLSQGLLDYLESFGGATTSGVHWRNGNGCIVPLRNWFCAKILCKSHNELLSVLDDEALTFFTTLQSVNNLPAQRSLSKPIRYTISGDKLERWFLKALCGFANSGNLRPNGEKAEIDYPPLEWLRPLFGLDLMKEGQGLYYRSQPGAVLSEWQTLGFTILINGEDILCGVTMTLAGLQFVLAMTTPDKNNPGPLLTDAVLHPHAFIFCGSGLQPAAIIDFDWAGTPTGSQSIMFSLK